MLQKLFDILLTIGYPQTCMVCRESVENFENGIACDACWNVTRLFSGSESSCEKCQRLLSEKNSSEKIFCHQCDGHFYDTARAVGAYENALRVSTLRLKNQPVVPRRLKLLLFESLKDPLYSRINCTIPVPLSRQRLKNRGFNQSTVLAKLIARKIGLELNSTSLVRTKHLTRHRSGMDKKGRILSIKNSFGLNDKPRVKDKHVLLVDDVFTSGATVSECARVLKNAGASAVHVITLARVVKADRIIGDLSFKIGGRFRFSKNS